MQPPFYSSQVRRPNRWLVRPASLCCWRQLEVTLLTVSKHSGPKSDSNVKHALSIWQDRLLLECCGVCVCAHVCVCLCGVRVCMVMDVVCTSDTRWVGSVIESSQHREASIATVSHHNLPFSFITHESYVHQQSPSMLKVDYQLTGQRCPGTDKLLNRTGLMNAAYLKYSSSAVKEIYPGILQRFPKIVTI